MVNGHPRRVKRTAPAHDTGNALRGERQMLQEHAAMHRDVINTLLGLIFNDFEKKIGREVFGLRDFLNSLINRNGADRNGARIHNGLADFIYISAGGKIHACIGAKFYGTFEFVQFFFNIGCHGGITDIGVNFTARIDADAGGAKANVIYIGRDNHAP